MSYIKFYKYKKQYSLDNGVTWQDVTPEEYVPSGEPIGYYDTLEECQSPPKYILRLSNSSIVSGECDSTSSISQSEVSTYAGSAVSVEIKECATSIGMSAFNGFNGLTSIAIPNNISTIGMFAFANCQNLSSCTLNYGVTSIGNYVFYECNNLSSIVIPDSVTFLGYAVFDGCTSLSSVTLPNNITSVYTGTFRRCTSLTGITIPNSVTNIYEQSFSACTSLTEITIPSGVTNIGYDAFWGCSGLTSITCLATTPPTLGPNVFDNTGNCPIYVPCESVEAYKTAWSRYESRIQCDFGGKYKLTLNNSSTVSADCDVSSAVTSGEISSYSSIVAAVIGNCVTTIGDGAFYNCYSLTAVTLGNSLTSIGQNAFYYCYSLPSITIPNSVTSIGAGAFDNCTSLTSCTIGTGVTTIGAAAFTVCLDLTSIDIPDSVTSIGESAFYKCESLTSVTIGNGVTSIGNDAFFLCLGLTSIDIPNSVTSIDYGAFYSCYSLTSVTIGTGVTSIGNNVFRYCSGLTSVTVNAVTPPTLGSNVFGGTNNCPIYVPCESVDTYKAASGWSDYASRIEGIPPCGSPTPSYKWLATYTGGTTSSAQCDSTSAITEDEINVANLAEIQIGNCVTTIDASVFYDLPWLTGVTMSENITNIGNKAFFNCANLQSITINAVTPPTVGTQAFMLTTCPIYVPANSVDTYKAASGWSSYSSRIQAIP